MIGQECQSRRITHMFQNLLMFSYALWHPYALTQTSDHYSLGLHQL